MAKGLVHLIDESIRLYGAILIWQKSYRREIHQDDLKPGNTLLVISVFSSKS